jgi:hypothetical protein
MKPLREAHCFVDNGKSYVKFDEQVRSSKFNEPRTEPEEVKHIAVLGGDL